MNAREKLLDRMIRIYGFEHPLVLAFSEMIEKPQFETQHLEALVQCHEKYPCLDSEDEEE